MRFEKVGIEIREKRGDQYAIEKLKGKNEKSVKKKMGFLVLTKHGLNKHEIRPKSGLILRERTVQRERRE